MMDKLLYKNTFQQKNRDENNFRGIKKNFSWAWKIFDFSRLPLKITSQ